MKQDLYSYAAKQSIRVAIKILISAFGCSLLAYHWWGVFPLYMQNNVLLCFDLSTNTLSTSTMWVRVHTVPVRYSHKLHITTEHVRFIPSSDPNAIINIIILYPLLRIRSVVYIRCNIEYNRFELTHMKLHSHERTSEWARARSFMLIAWSITRTETLDEASDSNRLNLAAASYASNVCIRT